MEVDVSKENVCINRLISEKKEIIFVEEDMIVPDSKPDILNAINLNGNVCIYKKEVMEGKVKIEGCVNTYIMYLPDSKDDNLRGLNATIDFSQIIPVADCKEGMNADIRISIKDLECKVLNGRKINLRAGLEVKLKLYSNEDIEIINGINDPNMQILSNNLGISSLVGRSSTRVYIKDTLNVPDQDEIAEILKVELRLVDSDIKISYNKILSKCEADVKIMYLTEDNRINTVHGRIPAVGFIDMQNISEENSCYITNDINNIIIRPNAQEEHSIYVEIEIETTCTAYEKKEISLIQDLYSPIVNIDFLQKKIVTSTDKISKTKNFTVTSKTNIPELTEGTLIDVEIVPSINKEQVTDSKVMYEGEMTLNFIFSNSNNSVNNKVSKIPFEFTVENPTNSENINIDTNVSIANKNFDVRTNGDVDCNLDLEIVTEFSQNESINVIDNIQMQDGDNDSGDYDSLIIYIAQKGDTLWKIAKKFKSTVDDIARVNGIENPDKLDIGQKLYIPKFRYSNKREVNNAI